jgi:hypothetical protein
LKNKARLQAIIYRLIYPNNEKEKEEDFRGVILSADLRSLLC